MSVQHPAWCSPRLCTAVDSLPLDGGEHRSEPIELDTRRAFTNRGAVGATLAYLTKSQCSWSTSVYLHLATNSEDLTMPLDQAGAVLVQLAQFVGQGKPT